MFACARVAPEAPSAAGLLLSRSAQVCAMAGVDADHDGLDDRCELELAQGFAPELLLDPRDCLWSAELRPPRLGGAYLFAARRTHSGIRIAYLPGYYRDCGWSGPVCRLRGGNCGAHAGDSELIVVDVEPTGEAGRWRTTGVFLSAHCFGRSSGRCRWYRETDLRAFAWVDEVPNGAPRVWVARGKHANYPTQRTCDRGHWFYDSCDQNSTAVRFPAVYAAQNIGSRLKPMPAGDGCIGSDKLPLGAVGTSTGARECPWDSSRPFWGWQDVRGGIPPSAYARYLELIGGF